MSKYKRHIAQPRLEPMEGRVAPSVMGAHALQRETGAAHHQQLLDSAAQANASHLARKVGAMTPRQIAHLKDLATRQLTGNAHPTSGIPGFFKSLFKNL
jgi:hypothetical protein